MVSSSQSTVRDRHSCQISINDEMIDIIAMVPRIMVLFFIVSKQDLHVSSRYERLPPVVVTLFSDKGSVSMDVMVCLCVLLLVTNLRLQVITPLRLG